MIYGLMHLGSGIGNQLFRFVGTKVLALDRGEEHSMIAPELFKGHDFMKLPLPANYEEYEVEYPSGKVIPKDMEGVVDGEFQAEKDFIHRLDEVRDWLKVEPLEIPDDLCIINYRAGEYKYCPELYLPKEYWKLAVSKMKEINPHIRFEVHTDDLDEANLYFPDYPLVRNIGLNWRSIRYAKYLILSNSSFAILPAWLNENAKHIIAPLYWARYNEKYWLNPDNNYSKFNYIHHEDNK